MIVCNFEKIEKIFFFVWEGRYGNYSFISYLFETFKKKILFFSEKWHVSVDEYQQIYSEQLTLCKLYFAWNYREKCYLYIWRFGHPILKNAFKKYKEATFCGVFCNILAMTFRRFFHFCLSFSETPRHHVHIGWCLRNHACARRRCWC